jgi:hypothetical protein
MLRAGFAGRIVFIAAVTMSKLHDWRRGEERGFLPRKDFDPRSILHHLGGILDDEIKDPLGWLAAGAAAAEREGLFERVEGGWQIHAWTRFQIDSSRDRTANWRARKKTPKTPRDGGDGHKAPQPQPAQAQEEAVTVCDGCDDDVTYVTGRPTSTSSHVRSSSAAETVGPAPAGPGACAGPPSPEPGRNGHPKRPPIDPATPGLAGQGSWRSGQLGSEVGLPNPAEQARKIREELLRPPPSKPIRGPDPPPPPEPPKVADPERLKQLRDEVMRKIAELPADEPPQEDQP